MHGPRQRRDEPAGHAVLFVLPPHQPTPRQIGLYCSPLSKAVLPVLVMRVRSDSPRDRWSSLEVGVHGPLLLAICELTRMLVMSTQPLAAVKARFSQVIDEVAGTHERVTVTRNGSPVAVILAV